ncbi:helix-turn-helix transcriptional regulator [Longimicrobium sp.]|uniref:helix-turn-helix domain-containing protein n=1 Tax=Longimicrobium sp. TaxID=2029185 RepID=UPI002E37B971|nr:helix-turn-helix transcriptional regulator [Longimicrobium sp.]HEX6039180.1 helix-turn-helix transcriptional regulator [Longimicrobium sp.]
MSVNETWAEYMARNLQDPEYAVAHAIGRPFRNLCLNVWSLRETKGLTQQQLAEAAQMKQPRIADIERDEANPTLQTISRVAFALGVTADRLLAEPDEAMLAEARSIVEARVATWSPARRRRLGLSDDEPQQSESAAPRKRRKTA